MPGDRFLDLLAAAQAVVEGEGELNVKEMGAAVARLRKALARVRVVPRHALMTRSTVEIALLQADWDVVREASAPLRRHWLAVMDLRALVAEERAAVVDLVCAVLGLEEAPRV